MGHGVAGDGVRRGGGKGTTRRRDAEWDTVGKGAQQGRRMSGPESQPRRG
jgi:hypothetical protein